MSGDRAVMTVRGPVTPEALGITDAHNHVWIEPIDGVAPGLPQLNDKLAILRELIEYRDAGGGAIVDCQPGGCGRNTRVLAELSEQSGVHIVTSTGFHLRKYYPPNSQIFEFSSQQAFQYFRDELVCGAEETHHLAHPIRAGFIKVACEASIAQTPRDLLEGAARAACETRSAIQVHTEKGADAENIFSFFSSRGVAANQIILCHMDKRPDLGLHCALAAEGVLLEYDTFYRPKYDPEKNLWPLIKGMVDAGWGHSIALAADMAEASLWKNLGGGPGLAGLITQIEPKLQAMGIDAGTIAHLLGVNIAQRLTRPSAA